MNANFNNSTKYEEMKRRLIEISAQLRSPETNQDEKQKLYNEQCQIIEDMLGMDEEESN